MTLKLTPTVLRAAYDFLCTTEPFCRWNLPEGEDIKFRVLRARQMDALIVEDKGHYTIGVSMARNGHVVTMLASLAHEMVHLHEARCKVRWRGINHHGAAFRKWAKQVCDAHGYDPKLFF